LQKARILAHRKFMAQGHQRAIGSPQFSLQIEFLAQGINHLHGTFFATKFNNGIIVCV
jgi:hypothetical protein